MVRGVWVWLFRSFLGTCHECVTSRKSLSDSRSMNVWYRMMPVRPESSLQFKAADRCH